MWVMLLLTGGFHDVECDVTAQQRTAMAGHIARNLPAHESRSSQSRGTQDAGARRACRRTEDPRSTSWQPMPCGCAIVVTTQLHTEKRLQITFSSMFHKHRRDCAMDNTAVTQYKYNETLRMQCAYDGDDAHLFFTRRPSRSSATRPLLFAFWRAMSVSWVVSASDATCRRGCKPTSKALTTVLLSLIAAATATNCRCARICGPRPRWAPRSSRSLL